MFKSKGMMDEHVVRPVERADEPYRVEEGVLVEPELEARRDTREARFEREYDPNLPHSEHPDLRCPAHDPAALGVDTSVHVRYTTPRSKA